MGYLSKINDWTIQEIKSSYPAPKSLVYAVTKEQYREIEKEIRDYIEGVTNFKPLPGSGDLTFNYNGVAVQITIVEEEKQINDFSSWKDYLEKLTEETYYTGGFAKRSP